MGIVFFEWLKFFFEDMDGCYGVKCMCGFFKILVEIDIEVVFYWIDDLFGMDLVMW